MNREPNKKEMESEGEASEQVKGSSEQRMQSRWVVLHPRVK